MMGVVSHPLELTESELLREASPDAWWRSLQAFHLHVRVMHARDLPGADRSGLSDPYVVLRCGQTRHRTMAIRQTLDPDWGEEFILEWSQVDRGKQLLLFEVWDWNFWGADGFLGKACVELGNLSFEAHEVQEQTLKLLPSDVRLPLRPQKPPLQDNMQQQLLRRAGSLASAGRDALGGAATGLGRAASGLFGNVRHAVGAAAAAASRQNSQQLQAEQQQQQQQQKLKQEQEKQHKKQQSNQHEHFGNGHQQQQAQQQRSKQQQQQQQQQQAQQAQPQHQLPQPMPELGELTVLLWWAPAHERQAFEAAEAVSFNLKPGEAKVPPVIRHTKLGTLYEEPCMMYVKLAVLEVSLGSSWHVEFLRRCKSRHDREAARQVAARIVGGWNTDDSDADVAAGDGASAADTDDEFDEYDPREDCEGEGCAGGISISKRQAPARMWELGGGQPGQEHGKRDGGGNKGGSNSSRISYLEQLQHLHGMRADQHNKRHGSDARSDQHQEHKTRERLSNAAEDAVWALLKVTYGKGQQAESQPVRVRTSGRALFRANFVFITKRPLQDKTLVLEVQLRCARLAGIQLTSTTRLNVAHLLERSPPPPTTWQGVHEARANQQPGIHVRLEGLDGAHAQLLMQAVDADARAATFEVPAMTVAAVTPRMQQQGGEATPVGALRKMARRLLLQQPARLPSDMVAPPSGGPLASLQLAVHRLELQEQPSSGFMVVLKCGPHWAQSSTRHSPDFDWVLEVPVYHPTATLIMVVYEDLGRRGVSFIGKLHYRISSLLIINHSEQVKTLKLFGEGRDEAGRRLVAGSALISFTADVHDRHRLMTSYEHSPYPPAVHLISLFKVGNKDAITQRHAAKVVRWLERAEPGIPSAVAWKVLETGRERFRIGRARHNLQRLREAVSWFPATLQWHQELKAWKRPWQNFLALGIVWCVCFYPRESLLVLVLWRSALALRKLLRRGFVEVLGVEVSDLLDTAGLLPAEGSEDNDEAELLAGGIGDDDTGGPGGSSRSARKRVMDSTAAMLFQPRRLRALKRRYDALLKVALQVQNNMDNIAMTFERLRAMVTGQDPLATLIFYSRCLMLAVAMWLLGMKRLVFAWWAWDTMRPPSWRSPPGIKGPPQFLSNLPSRSMEDL